MSIYFTAGAAAQSFPANYLPLTIYHLGSDGVPTPALSNVFSSGDSVWLRVPDAAKGPLLLEAYDHAGTPIWNPQATVPSPDNLLNLPLTPALFPPTSSYSIILRAYRENAPGLIVAQAYRADFAVIPASGILSVEELVRDNRSFRTTIALLDRVKNPKVGVRIGLFLREGESSLPLTTETTDARGRAAFQFGQALGPGNYSIEGQVLDKNAVTAPPLQISRFTIEKAKTQVSAWETPKGVKAFLRAPDSLKPIPGRLLLLEHRLQDGNWTISATSYTDPSGLASFSTPLPSGPWHVSFKGDTFYAPSASDSPPSSAYTQPPDDSMSRAGVQWSTFVGNTFTNGHITLKIGPSVSTIYDSQGQTVLGHMNWQVQFKDGMGSWRPLPWDGPLSMNIGDAAGYHRVTLQGTAGNDQVAVSMSFLARAQDAPYTPLQMPVDIQALRDSHLYRLVWHLDSRSAAFFQFEQRVRDQRTVVRGPITVGSQADQSPSGENSMVALASDGKTVLFGLNWDNTLQYYLGTSLGVGSAGTTASVQFGDVALSRGQHWLLSCCLLDGGSSGPAATTTTLYLPSLAYATIPLALQAQLKTSTGIGIAGLTVNFYNGTTLIGSGTTNSTGYSTVVWTPRITGSQTIKAEFTGVSGYSASSDQKVLGISKTPTVIMMLKPQPIAFSWDVNRPVVVPIVTLELALAGDGSPAKIYMPSYDGSSTTAPVVPGFGWRGLNQTLVTVTFNSTYTQQRTMNWTRNFYLPPCTAGASSSCSTTPRTGHMYLNASLSPPSTLYSASSTTLNIPYQNVNSLSTATGQLTQDATPPTLYVNVTASYPYLSVRMQDIPVSLAPYTIDLAYTLGSATALGGKTTFILLPNPSELAYVTSCQNSSCSVSNPSANTQLDLWKVIKNKLTLCGYVYTNSRGVAHLNLPGPTSSCTYPYDYASIANTSTLPMVVEVFRDEAVSTPAVNPFLTNFQGYNYAIYAPKRTGRYLLHMHTYNTGSFSTPYTILYPATAYPDVKWPSLACCDVFLNVAKHPVRVDASLTPDTATVSDKVNATVTLTDLANNTPLASASLNYTVTRMEVGFRDDGLDASLWTAAQTASVSALFGGDGDILELIVTFFNALSGNNGRATRSGLSVSTTTYPKIIIRHKDNGIGANADLTLTVGYSDATSSVFTLSKIGTYTVETFTLTAGKTVSSLEVKIQANVLIIAASNTVYWDFIFMSQDPTTVTSGTLTTNVNGTSVLPLGLLSYGNYTLHVSRTATSTLNAVTTRFDFTVYKAKPTVVISPGWIQNAFALETYTFRTSLVNNATQTLIAVAGLTEQVYINDVLYGKTILPGSAFSTDSGGNVTFSWTPATAGQYKIEVRLPQQSYYTVSSVMIVVSVARRSVVLAVNNSPLDPDVGQSVTWDVYAYDMINNVTVKSRPVSQYIDGLLTATNSTGSTGHATFTYTFSSRGSHNVTFLSAQNDTFNSATSYRPLTVFVKTTLTLQGGTVILGQPKTFTVALRDSSGTAIQGRLIRIEINSAFYQDVTTNSSGQAQFAWRPETTGDYSITARFLASGLGDLGYRASTETFVVDVIPQTTMNTDSTQSIGLNTAQGVTQTPSGATFSVSFPAWDTVTMTIQSGALSFQGSLRLSNKFGWSCVAWAGGFCVLKLPYLNAILNIDVPGKAQARLVLPVLSLSPFSVSLSVQGQNQVDRASIALIHGVTAAGITVGALLAPLIIARTPGAAQVAAAVYLAGMTIGIPLIELIGFSYSTKPEKINYSAGILGVMALEAGVAEVVAIMTGIVKTTVWPDVRVLLAFGWAIGLLMAVMFFTIFVAL